MRLAKVVCGVVFTVCASLLVLAGTNAGEKKNPATTPIVRDVPRHKEFLAIAMKGGVEVVFLGDSITQGWGNNKTWQKYYTPMKAANFGIGGDQTGHVLWRITEGKELEGITPKVAVLMIGTNNGHSAEQIAEGITLIVKTVHEKTPKTKVLLLGVFPRSAKPMVTVKKDGKEMDVPNPARVKIAAINKIIAKLDDGGKTVKFLDIGEKFLQTDGTLSKEVMPDALHLSAKGYEIWAEAMNPTLEAMLK